MKEKLRHPGIFLKILILFECILIIAVLVTSSYIMQRFSKTVMEKEIMLGDTKLDSLTDYCNENIIGFTASIIISTTIPFLKLLLR